METYIGSHGSAKAAEEVKEPMKKRDGDRKRERDMQEMKYEKVRKGAREESTYWSERRGG